MTNPEDLRRVRLGHRKVGPRDVPVEITKQALDAIRAASEGTIDMDYCRLLPNGMWRVMFSERVYGRMRSIMLPGESMSEALIRIMATKPKDGATRRRI